MLIENGTSTLHIFSTFSSYTHYGDEIEVVGKGEKYKGQWEVVANEIKIIKRWDVESIPLWELSEYTVEYDRKNVNVTEYVYKIFSTYLIITDEERNYEIEVLYPPGYNITVERYDHVYVKAFFSYDATLFIVRCLTMGIKRKVRMCSESLAITIPSQIAELHNIKEGDYMGFTPMGKGGV